MCELQFACISSSCTNITSTPPLTTLYKIVPSPKTQLQLPYTCSMFSATTMAIINIFYLSSSFLPLGCKLHDFRDFCLFVFFSLYAKLLSDKAWGPFPHWVLGLESLWYLEKKNFLRLALENAWFLFAWS